MPLLYDFNIDTSQELLTILALNMQKRRKAAPTRESASPLILSFRFTEAYSFADSSDNPIKNFSIAS